MKRKILVRLAKLYNAGGDLSKKWFVYYSVRDPKSGKMERFKEFTGIRINMSADERIIAANKLIIELNAKLKEGWTPLLDSSVIYEDSLQYRAVAKTYRKAVAANGTFSFYASKFIDSIRSRIEPSTLSTYTSKLRCFKEWLIGQDLINCDVSAITQDEYRKFFRFIIDVQQLSENSVKKYNQILFNVCEFVGKERKGYPNPVIDMPSTNRINDKTPRPIREDHLQRIKAALELADPQLFLACKLEYYCCLRPGKELRMLRIGDIDLYRGTIDVSRFRSKTKLARIVTIPEAFLNELRAMELEVIPPNWYLISHEGKPGPDHLGKNNLKQRWAVIRKENGWPMHYKLYSWKHTGNVRADDAGIPRAELQAQNGHTSIRTTEIYMKNKAGNISKNVRNLWPEL